MVILKLRLKDAIRDLTVAIMKAARIQDDAENSLRDELADDLKRFAEVILQVAREERETGTRLELDEPINWYDLNGLFF